MITGFTPTFPSIERLLVAWLPQHCNGIHVMTDLPHDFATPGGDTSLMPVIVVDRIAGADLTNTPILDRPVIDVDAYAGTRDEAQDLAEMARHALLWILPGSKVESTVFTRIRTVVGPRMLAHANPKVRRYSANYELLLHAQP